MGDLVILLLPLVIFLILRLEYQLFFGRRRILKSHALAHLGWLRHPDKDCMVKDGVESAMSKNPLKIDTAENSVDSVDKT